MLRAGLRRCPAPVLLAVAVSTLLVTAAAPAVSAHLPGHPSVYASPLMRLPEFVLGIVSALLMRDHRSAGPPLPLAGPLAVLGYFASAQPAVVALLPGINATAIAVPGYALLICALARTDLTGGRTLLATRPFVTLRRLSFAFYLVHLLVIASVSSPWPDGHPQIAWLPATLLTLTSLATAILLAAALHLVVEVPARRALLRSTSPPLALLP